MGANLEHVGVVVDDLDAAVAWYARWFAAEEVRRFARADLGIRAASLRLGEGVVELIVPDAPPSTAVRGSWPLGFFQPAGAHHLAVAVDDIDALFAEIGSSGAALLTGLVEGRFFFCRDPFGTLLEIRRRKS
jgi:methylmalonyl-CoA/ethylmalonyl-CoA epimerase